MEVNGGIFAEIINFSSEDIFNDSNNKQKTSVVKPTMKPSDRLLHNIKSQGFDMSQLESVLRTAGNQLILSCAGSGKTTSLIFKVLFDQKTGYATKLVTVNGNTIRVPQKIWVCTFLKTGAEELKRSLIKWQYILNCKDVSDSVVFSTLHAEFRRALIAMSVNVNIISESDNTKLLRQVVDNLALRNSKGSKYNSEDMQNLQGALTYTRNRLDNKRYESDFYKECNLTKPFIDAILNRWKEMRRLQGYYDFEDLQESLYEACYIEKNESVIAYLASRYQFIYIDEFQDISQIQYAIFKVYGSGTKQVVAIGDDDQTIYSWRGSDNTIITKEFANDFSPTINNLSINFRCPSNILNAIIPSIQCNTKRFTKDLKSSRDGGVVRYKGFGNYRTMSSTLSNLVKKDVKDGLSVAILCRVNSDGLMPALILDADSSISFSISSDGMTLESYIGRSVINIIKLFTEKYTSAVKSALGMLVWDNRGISELMKVCKNNNLDIWTIDSKDLSYSCPEIAGLLLNWRKIRQEDELKALHVVLEYYRISVFSKDTQFNRVAKSVISSVANLLDYYDFDNALGFLNELENVNDRLKARKRVNNCMVRIATVHEFKGKEADSIYVWNDTNEVYPYKKALDLGEDSDEMEEERRIHYIACTRARKISTMLYMETSVNSRSMFIDEMNLSCAEELTLDKNSLVFNLKSKDTRTREEKENFNSFASVSINN